VPAKPEPQKPQQQSEEVFEQVEDERGRMRTDRPFTASEAQAIDEANRQAFLEARANRFRAPTKSGRA
jgi:hypothetical protein